MKTALFVATAAASLVASADAGFSGFVAYSRNVGANTVIDVFAAVTNASDKFLKGSHKTTSRNSRRKRGFWRIRDLSFCLRASEAFPSMPSDRVATPRSGGGQVSAGQNERTQPQSVSLSQFVTARLGRVGRVREPSTLFLFLL